jgi:MoaA/NifB/PqqE/SkfB family radical SAM enzyme
MREMTADEWKHALEKLREWLGPAFISITGGEALLRKDAIDIAAHAANLGFWVEFLSNGWVLDEDKARRLVESGIKRMKISLDGSRDEVHDAVRGVKGFHERSSRAIQYMADQMRACHRDDLQIYAKTAIMSTNVEDLAGIVRFAKETGIYGVELQALEPTYYSDQQDDPNWYKNNPLWIDDRDTVSRAINELKELKEQSYPIINTMENLEMIEAYFHDPGAEKDRVHTHDYVKKQPECRDWAKGLQIDPVGDMRMCHWMDSFGNVKDGNLRHTWRHRSTCGRCAKPVSR